jgi:F0F1-type ATP synthase assembly protein I
LTFPGSSTSLSPYLAVGIFRRNRPGAAEAYGFRNQSQQAVYEPRRKTVDLMSDSRKSPDNPDPARAPDKVEPPAWIGMTSLGFEFLAAILLPGALGWWLDRLLGWTPWLMLVGGLVGFAAGLRLLLATANRSFKK